MDDSNLVFLLVNLLMLLLSIPAGILATLAAPKIERWWALTTKHATERRLERLKVSLGLLEALPSDEALAKAVETGFWIFLVSLFMGANTCFAGYSMVRSTEVCLMLSVQDQINFLSITSLGNDLKADPRFMSVAKERAEYLRRFNRRYRTALYINYGLVLGLGILFGCAYSRILRISPRYRANRIDQMSQELEKLTLRLKNCLPRPGLANLGS